MLNGGSSKLLFILFKDNTGILSSWHFFSFRKENYCSENYTKNQWNKLYAENKYKAVIEKVYKIVLQLSNIIGYLETLLFRVILCSVGYNTY